MFDFDLCTEISILSTKRRFFNLNIILHSLQTSGPRGALVMAPPRKTFTRTAKVETVKLKTSLSSFGFGAVCSAARALDPQLDERECTRCVLHYIDYVARGFPGMLKMLRDGASRDNRAGNVAQAAIVYCAKLCLVSVDWQWQQHDTEFVE